MLVGDYLYIGWRLSSFDWTGVILYSVCNTSHNCCCAQILVGRVTSEVVEKCGTQLII